MESWSLRGASVIGPGHIKDKLPNQDAIFMKEHGGCFIVVVCDGMGSRQYSNLGSRAACRAVKEITRESSFDLESETLISQIEQKWLQLIRNVRPDDAITTCLFAWGNKEGIVRAFQLGDGLIIGKNCVRSSSAGSHFGNETIGLGCKISAADWKCSEVIMEPGESLGLMTDGISEDLIPGREEDFLQALSNSLKSKNSRVAKKFISKQMHNWPTPNHLDDKSIVVVRRN